MLMNKAHVIKLKPTKTQEIFFKKSAGVGRFTYNWALAKRQEDFKQGVKWKAYDLIKYLNSIKREQFPWMLEVGKTCCQYPIHYLQEAYEKLWKKQGKFPCFKKKGVEDSFVAVENKERFKQANHKIWIPRLGWVKCCENLRYEGKVNNVVVKRQADMWFAVVNIEVPDETPIVRENQATVGVDMGIKYMLVLSDGITFDNPKALKSNLRRLKTLQRRVSRKQKGSANRRKARMRLARKHYRIGNLRFNAIHQATSYIVKNYGKIVVEDLNVVGMVKNRNLAQAISDVGFGELKRQLAYKALWQGKELVVADRWYASSKLCSACGHKKETLKLSERTYLCENCGLEIDRDLNAAKNLAAYRPTSELEGSYACGGRSSELAHSLPVNQEIELINNLNL